MKVLFVAKSFVRGGAATGARNLLLSLYSEDVEVVKVSLDDLPSNSLKITRLAERSLEHLIFGSNYHSLRFGPASVKLLDIAEKVKPDIIQLGDFSGNLIDFKSLSDMNLKIVHRLSDFWPYTGPTHYELQNQRYKYQMANFLFNYFYKRQDLKNVNLVMPSEWLRKELNKSLDEFKHCGMRSVILNAVENAKFKKNLSEDDGITVGFIAKNINSFRKGLKQLLRLLKDDCFSELNLKLCLYGDGYFEGVNMDNNVSIAHYGRYSEEQKHNVYSNIDILLIPSLQDNSPNVVSEAMSFGVPCIGQESTGMESYISIKNGRLFDFWSEHADARELKSKILEIKKCYNSFSDECKDFTDSQLSYSSIGKQYYDLYRYLTSTR